MHRLIEGALRFQAEIHGLARQGGGQNGRQAPFAMFIACSDSRVVPEVLTQREPGDIFVVRNAGNIIPSYGPAAGGVSASIEYAVAALGIEDVVVCGHTDCGAMKAILREDRLDKMPAVASWIKHAAAAKEIVAATLPEAADERTRLHALVHENVLCRDPESANAPHRGGEARDRPAQALRLGLQYRDWFGGHLRRGDGPLRTAHAGPAGACHAQAGACLSRVAELARDERHRRCALPRAKGAFRPSEGAELSVRDRDVGALFLLRDARDPHVLSHRLLASAGAFGEGRRSRHPEKRVRMVFRPSRNATLRLAHLWALYVAGLFDAHCRRPHRRPRARPAAHRRHRRGSDGHRAFLDGVRGAAAARPFYADIGQRCVQAEYLHSGGRALRGGRCAPGPRFFHFLPRYQSRRHVLPLDMRNAWRKSRLALRVHRGRHRHADRARDLFAGASRTAAGRTAKREGRPYGARSAYASGLARHRGASGAVRAEYAVLGCL